MAPSQQPRSLAFWITRGGKEVHLDGSPPRAAGGTSISMASASTCSSVTSAVTAMPWLPPSPQGPPAPPGTPPPPPGAADRPGGSPQPPQTLRPTEYIYHIQIPSVIFLAAITI